VLEHFVGTFALGYINILDIIYLFVLFSHLHLGLEKLILIGLGNLLALFRASEQ
jgi:hypothetical protein